MLVRLRNTDTMKNEYFETTSAFMIPNGIKGLECEDIIAVPEGEKVKPLDDSGVYQRILNVGIPLTEIVRKGTLWAHLGVEA